MEDFVSISNNLFNQAVSQLAELGYCFEDTCYVVDRDSTHSIFEDDDESPPPGISLVFPIPKNGYLGICLSVNYEECGHKIWCNTEEQITSVISNFDSIIKYWHRATLKLDDLYKEMIMADNYFYREMLRADK